MIADMRAGAGAGNGPAAVVGTKVDKQSGNERSRNLATLKRDLGVEDLLFLSSKTGFGLKDLWKKVEDACGFK